MNTLSFVLGMVSIVAIIFIIAFVVAVLKIFKMQNQLGDINQNFQHVYTDIDHRFDSVYNTMKDNRSELIAMNADIYRALDSSRTECMSYTDSRFDKATSKSKGAKQILKD